MHVQRKRVFHKIGKCPELGEEHRSLLPSIPISIEKHSLK